MTTAPSFNTNPVPPSGMGLPLSPQFEAARRLLEDQLSATLAQIAAARGMIDPRLQLNLARLGTDQSRDTGLMHENEVGRGVFDSSIRGMDTAHLNTMYDRSRQDLGNQAGDQYQQLAYSEGNAQLGYQQGLMDLLLQQAADAANDPYSPMPQYGGPGGGYGPRMGQFQQQGQGNPGMQNNGNNNQGNNNQGPPRNLQNAPNRDAPLGWHVNQAGQVIRNRQGRR